MVDRAQIQKAPPQMDVDKFGAVRKACGVSFAVAVVKYLGQAGEVVVCMQLANKRARKVRHLDAVRLDNPTQQIRPQLRRVFLR